MVTVYVKESKLKSEVRKEKALRTKIRNLRKAKLKKKLELVNQKKAMQAEIARRKLILGLRDAAMKERRPVDIMRNVEDKIPPAFSEENSIFGNIPTKQKMRWL